MNILTMIFFVESVLANAALTPFPLFLRQGFSCVLEFDSAPKQVVVGDQQNFQVEKMERSLVIRSLATQATSNMFVYFDSGEPRLFVLKAAEDAEPTLYRKFDTEKKSAEKKLPAQKAKIAREGIFLISAKFDPKKDYLTVDVGVSAGSKSFLQPIWEAVRLKFSDTNIVPNKTWAERKEVQRDSKVKARFIFTKPNVPKDLSTTSLIVPLSGRTTPLSLNLGGK